MKRKDTNVNFMQRYVTIRKHNLTLKQKKSQE